MVQEVNLRSVESDNDEGDSIQLYDLTDRTWLSAITMVADGGNVEQWVSVLYSPAVADKPAIVATSKFSSQSDDYLADDISGASIAELSAITMLADDEVHVLRNQGDKPFWVSTTNGFLSELGGFASTYSEETKGWLMDSIPAFECLYAYAELPDDTVIIQVPLDSPFPSGFIRVIVPSPDEEDPEWDGFKYTASWAN